MRVSTVALAVWGVNTTLAFAQGIGHMGFVLEYIESSPGKCPGITLVAQSFLGSRGSIQPSRAFRQTGRNASALRRE